MAKLPWFFLCFPSLVASQTAIPSLTADQWRQDLGYFVSQITTYHRDPYHLTNKAQFEQAVASLRERIPSMKDYEIIVGFERLAALVGDGHTFIQTANIYHRFPLEAFWFGDDLRVVRAAPEYKRALGTRIVAIGAFSISEIRKKLQPLIPQGENRWYVLSHSAEQIMKAEPLAALGILREPGPADFTLEDDGGHRFTLRVRPVPPGGGSTGEVAAEPAPLPFLHADEPFWFTYLADSETVYVDFRSYQDLETNAARLWDFIPRRSVKRLVIDMRWNEGGNYAKGRDYLIYQVLFLPALNRLGETLNRRGRLFVITGRKTFSAGMTNVTDFRRETEAILVGEPTGARPNGYQENHWFTLSNSKLRASCAMHAYRFQPLSPSDTVSPDQRIDPDWQSFREGKDAALDWILAQRW